MNYRIDSSIFACVTIPAKCSPLVASEIVVMNTDAHQTLESVGDCRMQPHPPHNQVALQPPNSSVVGYGSLLVSRLQPLPRHGGSLVKGIQAHVIKETPECQGCGREHGLYVMGYRTPMNSTYPL